MTENLDHPQQTGHYYYNWDTDLNSKTKWAPTANFIDGTVAGTPADLTTYADSNYEHDHTFYGKGCKNGWGTDGDGGSITPCADSDAGGRYITTADGETQKNGTLFTFQAATSGTGGTISTETSDSPDTFCPLGWHMPYSGRGGDYYDKSKSWNYLFDSYGITYNDGGATQVTKIKSYPFSYVNSGNFFLPLGRLYSQSTSGYYWSSIVAIISHTYDLYTSSSNIKTADMSNKSIGFAIRCVTRY